MSTYWVDSNGLDDVALGSGAHARDHSAVADAWQARASAAMGAFANDEDNRKFEKTFGEVRATELQISSLFANVVDRIGGVSANYQAADASARETSDRFQQS
ncbi:hypothetical protein [Streptomyces sp. NPDC048639]|uniref:hypothetical protein n=1 Tax=Streptomyces sp. NPDC048639 TaxID=3365581 RepID=UPI003712D631